MDRAFASEAKGRRFESCQAYQITGNTQFRSHPFLTQFFAFGFQLVVPTVTFTDETTPGIPIPRSGPADAL